MFRNLEIGDKVTIVPFIGSERIGKITKIGRTIIYVDVLKFIDGTSLVIPESMKFDKNTFIGIGKHYLYNIADVMYGEHEKFV